MYAAASQRKASSCHLAPPEGAVTPQVQTSNPSMLSVQELKAKGLAAADIDHGLRTVFGDAMRVDVLPADEDDDDGVTADTRFGALLSQQKMCCTTLAPAPLH